MSSEIKGFEGFEGYDEEDISAVEVEGVTDKVNRYSMVNIDYPCIMVKEGVVLEKHKWVVLSRLVGSGGDYSFYIRKGTDIMKAGSLLTEQVVAIIEILGVDNIEGFISEDKKLVGDRLYVLASTL